MAMMESDKPIRMLRDRFFGFNLVEKAEGRRQEAGGRMGFRPLLLYKPLNESSVGA